jgi:hypothetical protein
LILFRAAAITDRKLINTNGNIDEIFTSIDYNELYQQNILAFYSSVNADGNILSVYTNKITTGKERIKKKPKSTMKCYLYR